MPRYFKSTANKPGGGVRKGYRRGGRNLRDEEARVIGVQDNAADELRRVRARRPHDAAERRDRRAQLSRVGSRERNARDEMARLRGYQYGGAIGRQAAAMGPAIAARIPSHIPTPGRGRPDPVRPPRPDPRFTDPEPRWFGNYSRRGPVGYQYGGAIGRQAAAFSPSINVDPAAIRAAVDAVNRRAAVDYPTSPRGAEAVSEPPSWVPWASGGRVGYQAGGEIAPDMSAVDLQLAELETEMAELRATDPRLQRAKRAYDFEQTPEGAAFKEYMNRIHRDQAARNARPPSAPLQGRAALRRGKDAYNYGNLPPRGSQYGGRVGFKKGGRISRKKGTKFI